MKRSRQGDGAISANIGSYSDGKQAHRAVSEWRVIRPERFPTSWEAPYKDRLGVGTLAHLPGVRGDALLRQLAQPASQQARARDEASGHRVGRTGRTLAVLLSRRRLRGILMARRYGATATVLWVAASTASVVTTCPNSSCSVAITAR